MVVELSGMVYQLMKTVVTGASGHIGGNLVRTLLSQGRAVRVLIHRDQRAIDGLDVEIVKGDVRDLASLYRAFSGMEVVYHLAAYISILASEWPRLELINVYGTQNVIKACLHCGVQRLIYFSSIHAFTQKPLDVPIDESRSLAESETDPPYDRSKAAAEKEVYRGIEQGLETVIIIPTGVIGPYDYRPSHIGQVLLNIASSKMPALVDGGFNWVDVRDVIKGALRAEEKLTSGDRYILSGHWCSIEKLADIVGEIVGVPPPPFVCPMWLAQAGVPFVSTLAYLTKKRQLYTKASLHALCGNRSISCQKARCELDYHPRPLQETLIDTMQWFQDTGFIL